MPELSRFYGIIIRMYFDDHSPPLRHSVSPSQSEGESERGGRVGEMERWGEGEGGNLRVGEGEKVRVRNIQHSTFCVLFAVPTLRGNLQQFHYQKNIPSTQHTTSSTPANPANSQIKL